MAAAKRTICLTLAAGLLFFAAAAFAEGDGEGKTPPPPKPKKRYSICLWPNPCGATGIPSKAPDPKKEKGVKKSVKAGGVGKVSLRDLRLYSAQDPLTKVILHGRINGKDGVTSAVRLKPEFSGWDQEQILYRGEGSLQLPPGVLKADSRTKNGGTGPEWEAIDREGRAADQVNGMREHQGSLREGSAESRDGLDKMWGKK